MMGAPPPTVSTRSDVPAPFAAVLAPMQAALDGCGARGPFASVAWGGPEPDDGHWLDLDAFASEAGAAPVIARYPAEGDAARLTGHWVFQNACGTPLLAAGYLYAAQRRVPSLRGNVLLHNSQWLQHLRLLQPRLWALPDDPLAGTAGVTVVPDRRALTAALFAEVQCTYGPIVQGFRARRQTSTPNGWASVVDGLLQGFLLAGSAEIGLDAAWDLWQATIGTWDVPTRRWPRRLPFAEAGLTDEVVVRAACCLICTATDADGQQHKHCPNCPIDIGDAGRIRWMADWLTQLAGGQQADRPS